MTNRVEELYQEIADVIVDIVPEKWKKVYVNAQVQGMDSKAFLYYVPAKSEDVMSGAHIPEKFKAYKDLYAKLLEELEVTFSQLWFALKEEDEDVFTNVTYILSNDGEIDVDYDEQPVTDLEQHHASWLAKYVNK